MKPTVFIWDSAPSDESSRVFIAIALDGEIDTARRIVSGQQSEWLQSQEYIDLVAGPPTQQFSIEESGGWSLVRGATDQVLV